jgi:hypothetical protein
MQQDFAREVLGRLPLAEAMLTLWRWATEPFFCTRSLRATAGSWVTSVA